jgi:hypothetical protein
VTVGDAAVVEVTLGVFDPDDCWFEEPPPPHAVRLIAAANTKVATSIRPSLPKLHDRHILPRIGCARRAQQGSCLVRDMLRFPLRGGLVRCVVGVMVMASALNSLSGRSGVPEEPRFSLVGPGLGGRC